MPIVIDVFGVTAPYGNPYGSKIAIVWLFFVIFWPFWSHFQLLWSRLCIKLAPSAPKPSSHIGPLMRQPFFPVPGTYPGIQGPKNGYFLAKSGPNGPGWLQARPVHLERAWCAISHPNWWESIAWGHFCQFQAPIQASRAPKMAIFWLNPDQMNRGGSRLGQSPWKGPGVPYHILTFLIVHTKHTLCPTFLFVNMHFVEAESWPILYLVDQSIIFTKSITQILSIKLKGLFKALTSHNNYPLQLSCKEI